MNSYTLYDLLTNGQTIGDNLIAFRRELHSTPELSLHESETAAKVACRLTELGLSVKTGVGGHGLFADLQGKKSGPIIALRADMDALPIQEQTGLPFASKNSGVMHACGHDAHTAILLGAAMLLYDVRDSLNGSVRFVFQGAEEITAGAKAMIEDGVLDNVNEIYGLHNMPNLPAGEAATRYGFLMGSIDRFEIVIEGKGGHAAMPEQAIDPVVAASAVVMALQTIVSREISPFEPAVVTVGSISGGDTHNVIPSTSKIIGTVRTFSPKTQAGMQERIRRLAQQVAAGYRCQVEINYTEHVPVLVNHDQCVRNVEDTIDQLIGRTNRSEALPILGGEDFSIYLNHVPGCYFWLGSGPKENAEQAFGLHHPKFNLNENCIPLGAALLASIAFNRLTK